jgi:triacylglycerol lipase
MPMQLHEDAMGDWRNAQALAAASDLAYLPETEAKSGFQELLGLDAKLLSVNNTQVYVATSPEHIVVAFRGTEAPTSIDGLKDWLLTDALNLFIVPEGQLGTDLAAAGVGSRFHQGFVNATADIWPEALGTIEAEAKKEDRPIWITGHSLGGALALFGGWLLRRKFINVHQIYTYGAPMVGNRKACDAFDQMFSGKIYRFINRPDPVPKLPTFSLLANEFTHCEKEMGLGDEEPASEGFSRFVGSTVDGVLNRTLVDDIWTWVKGRVDAHSMTNYVNLIKAKVGA